MRFSLIDRILAFEPGVRLTAVKNVSLSEEYLADHFPKFPVLPGVFMLEAMTQAAAWLMRMSEDYAHSIVLLKEARNVRYADFVSPGAALLVTVEILKQDDRFVTLKGQGHVDNRPSLSGRLVIERYNLADEDPAKSYLDHQIIQQLRTIQEILTRGLERPQGTKPT